MTLPQKKKSGAPSPTGEASTRRQASGVYAGLSAAGRWGYYPKITVLKPRVGVQGYLTVGLWRDGVSQTNMVHRLVARAFYGPRPDDLEIRHLDDDKLNNWVVNLIYGTRRENKLDAVRNGIHDQSRKTHCPRKHEYTEENTYHSPGRPNARWCRKCTRIRNQEYAARQREKAGKAKQR